VRDAREWKLHKISRPGVQHGTYSFYFYDADDNAWRFSRPAGRLFVMFERGDQEGVGHMSRTFERPASTCASGEGNLISAAGGGGLCGMSHIGLRRYAGSYGGARAGIVVDHEIVDVEQGLLAVGLDRAGA